MLTLRFLRTGRRNRAFFRIVLTEKSKPAKSGFNKILGWYDPQTKKSSFEKEEVLKLVKNGAIPSNSLAKLLKEQKVTHKNIKFIPDTPKKAKVKEGKEIKKPEEKIEESKEEIHPVESAKAEPQEAAIQQGKEKAAETLPDATPEKIREEDSRVIEK